MSKIFPLNDYLLIQKNQEPHLVEGFYIPMSVQASVFCGEVKQKGPLVEDVDVGEKVIFEKFCGFILENDQVLVPFDKVLAILE